MGGKIELGTNPWVKDTSLYFGIGQRLTEQEGFDKLPRNIQAQLRCFDPVGTPRGFTVVAGGEYSRPNAGARVEIQPDRIIFSADRDEDRLEVIVENPFSILRSTGDLRPVLEMDLPQEHRRDRGERFNDELE